MEILNFVKMQGIGNDFVMVDALAEPTNFADLGELASFVCDRRRGAGGDGLILIERGDVAPFRMRMFNPDGSESEMCGNGLRCFGRLIKDRGYVQAEQTTVEPGAGVLELQFLSDGLIRINMGKARLTRGEIGILGEPSSTFQESKIPEGYLGTAVSMGNPHVVIFVDDVSKVDLSAIGPTLEIDPQFINRTNVHFVQIVDRTHLIQRTWERGAGITLACGTGACACGVAAFITGRADRTVDIKLPGGPLRIEYLEDGSVFMTGPATVVFEGTFDNLPRRSTLN